MTGAGAIEAKLVEWAPTVLKGLAVAVGAAAPDIDPRLREVTLLAGAAVAGETAARLQAADPWRAAIATATAAAAATTGLVQATRLAGEVAAAAKTATALAPLAGSLTVASARALDRLLDEAGIGGDGRLRTAAIIGAAGAGAAGVALLSRGSRGYAMAAGWALAGVAVEGMRNRRGGLVLAATVGLAAIGAATWYAANRR